MKENLIFENIAKMTVTENWDDRASRNLWFPCDKFIDYYRTNACAI